MTTVRALALILAMLAAVLVPSLWQIANGDGLQDPSSPLEQSGP